MYAFTYHRPTDRAAGREPARQAGGGEAPRRRPHADPDHEAAARRRRSNIVDLSQVEGLSGIELKGRSLVDRRDDAGTSRSRTRRWCKENIPALADLAGLIGDPAVRHRGTIGGSVANNDPNADYPAAVLGLGATIITNKRAHRGRRLLQGPVRDRARARRDHHQGPVPDRQEGGYEKFPQPGLALCAGRRVRRRSAARTSAWRSPAPARAACSACTSFEEALKKRFGAKSLEGLTIPATGMNSDIHGSAEYRAHLVGVLARRAVARRETRCPDATNRPLCVAQGSRAMHICVVARPRAEAYPLGARQHPLAAGQAGP